MNPCASTHKICASTEASLLKWMPFKSKYISGNRCLYNKQMAKCDNKTFKDVLVKDPNPGLFLLWGTTVPPCCRHSFTLLFIYFSVTQKCWNEIPFSFLIVQWVECSGSGPPEQVRRGSLIKDTIVWLDCIQGWNVTHQQCCHYCS